jgi:hypothetical protein
MFLMLCLLAVPRVLDGNAKLTGPLPAQYGKISTLHYV